MVAPRLLPRLVTIRLWLLVLLLAAIQLWPSFLQCLLLLLLDLLLLPSLELGMAFGVLPVLVVVLIHEPASPPTPDPRTAK